MTAPEHKLERLEELIRGANTLRKLADIAATAAKSEIAKFSGLTAKYERCARRRTRGAARLLHRAVITSKEITVELEQLQWRVSTPGIRHYLEKYTPQELEDAWNSAP